MHTITIDWFVRESVNSCTLSSHVIETAAVGTWAEVRGTETSKRVRQASAVRILFM